MKCGCRWQRCRLDYDLTYLGVRLCQRHYEQLVDLMDRGRRDLIVKRFPRLSGKLPHGESHERQATD